jgi:hypothetical protein
MPRRKKEIDSEQKITRRSRGEGSVIRRADGRFEVRIPLGKGKRKSEYYETEREAEKARRRLLHELEHDQLILGKDQSVKAYLLQWLDVKQSLIEPSTYHSYESYVRVHIIPEIGYIKLSKLTSAAFVKS